MFQLGLPVEIGERVWGYVLEYQTIHVNVWTADSPHDLRSHHHRTRSIWCLSKSGMELEDWYGTDEVNNSEVLPVAASYSFLLRIFVDDIGWQTSECLNILKFIPPSRFAQISTVADDSGRLHSLRHCCQIFWTSRWVYVYKCIAEWEAFKRTCWPPSIPRGFGHVVSSGSSCSPLIHVKFPEAKLKRGKISSLYCGSSSLSIHTWVKFGSDCRQTLGIIFQNIQQVIFQSCLPHTSLPQTWFSSIPYSSYDNGHFVPSANKASSVKRCQFMLNPSYASLKRLD